MLTVRINPKISVKPEATTNIRPGERHPVEQGDTKSPGSDDGRAGGRSRREEQHPTDDEHDRQAHRNGG